MKRLKILSWNADFMSEAFQPITEQSAYTQMAQEYLIKQSNIYDIVCLENAYHDKPRATIIEGLNSHYPFKIDSLMKNKFQNVNSDLTSNFNIGLTVLSKIPLTPLMKYDFLNSDSVGINSYNKNHGFIIVGGEWNQSAFQLAVCNIQHNSLDQFENLQMGLNNMKQALVPQIICGDFSKADTSFDEMTFLKQTFEVQNLKPQTKWPKNASQLMKNGNDYVWIANANHSEVSNLKIETNVFLNPEIEVEIQANAALNIDPDIRFIPTAQTKNFLAKIKSPISAEIFLTQPVPFKTRDKGQSNNTGPKRIYNQFATYSVDNNLSNLEMNSGIIEIKKIIQQAYLDKMHCVISSNETLNLSAEDQKNIYQIDLSGEYSNLTGEKLNAINWVRLVDVKNQQTLNTSMKQNSSLVEIGAGITLKELCEKLEHLGSGYAIPNLSSRLNQTFAAASNCSMYGSSTNYGAMQDIIRSVVLVTLDQLGMPKAYRIEPQNGPTEATHFKSAEIDELIKDDELFYATLCSMGTFGVIQSYIIEASPFYLLDQKTEFISDWNLIEKNGIENLQKEIDAQRHFELILAPSAQIDNGYECIKIKGNSIEMKSWISGQSDNSVFNTHAANPVKAKMNLNEWLASKEQPTKYFEQLKNENVLVKKMDIEFATPMHNIFNVVKNIKNMNAKNENKELKYDGMIHIKFVNSSKAFMSPVHSAKYNCFATFKLSLPLSYPNSGAILKMIQQQLLEDHDVRMHWGATLVDSNDISQVRLNAERFPEYNRWLNAYKKFNTSGVFKNSFTRSIGLNT